MSKFFKALEQARRDRTLRNDARSQPGGDPVATPAVAAPRSHIRPAPAPLPEVDDAVDERLVSLVAPAALEAEQYRALRNIVEQLHRTAHLQVIAVSSPGIGEGKTVTAINLAGALAQAPDARVLLIDADLRRPSVGRMLALGTPEGLDLVDAILDVRLTVDRVAQPRPPFNLHVVCAGQPPPSPYEVLKSARLGELIDDARRQYDFVVIDTPPLTPVQDCRIISRWVDGLLLVVAANRTTRRLLEESLATVDQGKVLGIVFNEDDGAASSQYPGHYGHYFQIDSAQRADSANALKRAAARIGTSLRPRWPTRTKGHRSRGPRR